MSAYGPDITRGQIIWPFVPLSLHCFKEVLALITTHDLDELPSRGRSDWLTDYSGLSWTTLGRITGWLMDYLGLRWTTGPVIMITVKLEYSAVINFAAEVLTSLTVKLDTTWQLVKGSMSKLWLVCHITIWLQAPYFAIVEKTRLDVGLLIVVL